MLAAVATLPAGGLWGCARMPVRATLRFPAAKVVLEQPHAPRSQQRLELTSDWSFLQRADGRRECVLAFPLPGAEDGPRDFHIFLSLPDADGDARVATDASGVRGFLIDEVSLTMLGKTEFSAGHVRSAAIWFTPGARRLDLDLTCEDGTHIRGTARVREDALELRAFRRRFGADIAALLGDESQPEPAGSPTSPRELPRP